LQVVPPVRKSAYNDNKYFVQRMPSAEPPLIPNGSPAMSWGSDVVAELLRRLDIPHIALNPGASYRGLHDSLVNYLGNDRPAIVLCLHEEHAVAVAHGYAKVTGRPLAVALHSNVGLMHATMALFNAFCDRVPMLVLGATGPLDAAARRPWIDWIHTAADQGALIRSYVKWDDQPGSPAAAAESLVRAHQITTTYPPAPVYVCLDAAVQEDALPEPVQLPDLRRHIAPPPPEPGPGAVAAVREMLAGAQRPLILVGRVGRDRGAWDARVRVAERYGAAVLTDLKAGAGFPTAHRLHPAAPGTFLTAQGAELVRGADVIVGLDWIDLGGTLRQAYAGDAVTARVISCTLDHVLHNGWSKDHFEIPAVDLALQSHPDLLIGALDVDVGRGAEGGRAPGWPPPRAAAAVGVEGDSAGAIRMADLAAALNAALADRRTCLVRLPLGWQGRDLVADDPLDYLGQDGGAGLGSGPGMTVGAALALRDSGRLAVAVLGDGDFLMGAQAVWTAAHLGLPLLIVVANNRTYFNDEMHQERVARRRGRPVENRSVGQRIADPDPDLAQIASALGLAGIGPVTDLAALSEALGQALERAQAGAAVLVDVRIAPEGYATGAPAPSRG
jgi:thiamine pyrophosphate-dependent acetolactate synthase large subunit-like protein